MLDAKALASELNVGATEIAPELLAFEVPFTLRRRGVEMKIVAATAAAIPDPTLLQSLFKAHDWARDLREGRGITEIAQASGHSESLIRTRAQLAFLSPRMQQAILDGTQPAELTLKQILRGPIPLDWDLQERLYELSPA